MESLFENKTIYIRRLFMEASNAVYRKNRKFDRMVLLIISVILMISALVFLGIYLANKDIWDLVKAGGFFVLCVVFLILHFKAYVIRAKGVFKTNRALCPNGEYNYTVYSDRIEIASSQSTRTIPLEQITQVFETRNTCCFMVQKSLFFITKDGFVKGTYVEFKQFLKEACGKKFA